MGRELYLNKRAFELEINALKYSAEKLKCEAGIPCAGGNMPALNRIMETYAVLEETVNSYREMLLVTADNIKNAAETVAETDRNLLP